MTITARIAENIDLKLLSPRIDATYEEEEFPGLMWKPIKLRGECRVFSNGKVVVLGVRSTEEAEVLLETLKRKLEEI